MMQKQDIIPIVGLNTDDDPRHFEQGDYEAARNLHTGITQSAGDEGLIASIKSTLGHTITGLSATSGIFIYAKALDEENDRGYLLVWGSVGIGDYEFYIIKHNFLDDTFKIIYTADADIWNINQWGALMQKCYNARIVDDRLILTDDVNDIRQIDVVKMEATTDAGIDAVATIWNGDYSDVIGYSIGDFVWHLDRVYVVIQATIGIWDQPFNEPTYYTDIAAVVDVYLDPIDPNNFTLAALPPLIAATAEYIPTPSIAVNQLKGKTWQFSYQYVYMDYRRSTYAPPSLVPAPSQEETVNGDPETDPSHNNTIRLQINAGNEQVRSIRVVARTSEDPSTWFVIDEIYVVNDKDQRVIRADWNLYVYFYNDKVGQPVPTAEVINLFHYVPIRAKHMELIEGNRLAFGNITEGYSRIGTQVAISLAWEDLSGISTQTVALNVIDIGRQVSEDIFDYLLRFTIPSINPGPCQFQIYLNLNDGNGEILVIYNYNGTDAYPSTVTAGLLGAIEAQWSGEAAACFSGTTAYQFCAFPRTASTWNRPYTTWTYRFQYVKSTVTAVDKVPQLKTGATHAWGLIYRDIAGRICPISGAAEMTKYIPFPTENTDSNVGRKPLITFEINHLPPPQAESYEVVYAGNKSTSWHLQLMGYNFAPAKKDHTDAAYPGTPWADYYRLRIKKCQGNTRDNLLNWSVEEYVWQKGDRIRIIGKVGGSGSLTEINDAIYDVEIMAVYDDTENENTIGDGSIATETTDEWIYFPINNNISFTPTIGSSPNYFPDNLMVEIYRPFTTESNLYFTTGMTFAIDVDVYGNKYHKGNVDQVLNASGQPSTPASVANTSHDNWKYPRNFRNVYDDVNFALWAESQYASDFYYTQKLTSQGSPIPNIDSQQQNVLTKRMRHGGKVSIGSQSNLIADFEYDDYLDLKDEHGPIEGMRLVGFVLKVVQYTKVVSVYISRQESFTASGQAQYLFTDKVFGSARPSMENYGSQHPDSIEVHNRHLYFWDQSEGSVIRDAANGIIPISSNKMNRYFKDKADWVKAQASQHLVWVHFAFAKATNELFCLFGYDNDTQEIITFNEDDQRWKNQFDVDFEQGAMYWIGKRLFISFGDSIYEWGAGATYQELTGTTRIGQLVVYANQDPAKVKIFQAIHIYQTGGDPVVNSVIVPEKATAGEGEMETNVYAANIEEKEGVFYCSLLKDINTPGPETQQWKELNGREMRGLYCQIDLQIYNGSSKITLSNLAVVTTGSERSK